MPKKYTEEDSNSTFDFAEWGDRGALHYAPPKTGALAALQKRLALRLRRKFKRAKREAVALPKKRWAPEPASSRFVWQPGDLRPLEGSTSTQKSVGAFEWQDLPTLVWRSFGGFLILQAQATANTVAFQRHDPITMDGEDALVPLRRSAVWRTLRRALRAGRRRSAGALSDVQRPRGD
jgi:hypothetical protein